MNRTMVAGALAVVAVFAGVIYFARDSADESAAESAAAVEAGDASARPAAQPAGSASGRPIDPASRTTAASNPVPYDPRLAGLAVSQDNGLIQFIVGSDGKVIQEVDNDPNSPGYKKPTREYLYAGDQVVGLTQYRYLGDQVEITKTLVSYKPDGSVDQFNETIDYQERKAANGG